MGDDIKLHAADVTDSEAVYTTVEAADMRPHVGHVIRCEARGGGARVVCVTCDVVLVATEVVPLVGEGEGNDG